MRMMVKSQLAGVALLAMAAGMSTGNAQQGQREGEHVTRGLDAAQHAQTTSAGGKVYVFGGFSRPGKELAWQPIDNAWEYTADTDTWKALAPLPSKRGAGGAAEVNGK